MKPMTIERPIWLVLLAAGLAGCAQVFPPPAAPKDPLPAGYRATALPARLATPASGSQTVDASARLPAAWWRAYGSPTLDALVEEGLANNQNIKQATHQLQAARHIWRAAVGASELPSLDASLSGSRQRSLNLPLPFFPEPTSLSNLYTADVVASYTFDFFGKAYQSNRALAEQADQQAWLLEATRQSVALNIVAGAINVALLGEQATLLHRQAALSREQAGRMEARRRLGGVPQDRVLALQQQQEAYVMRLAATERQLAAARDSLSTLLGRTPDRMPADLTLASLRLPERLPLSVPSRLLEQRPDIRAAGAAMAAAADQAGAAAAALYPSLTISAEMGHNGYRWADLTSPANVIWGAGAGLTLPLFHGGALRAERDAAQAQYQAALAQYRQTVIAAFAGVADALAGLETDAATVGALDAQRGQSERLWQNGLARYRLGAASRDEAIAAELSWLDVRQQHAAASARRLIDSAGLFYALGAPVAE